MMQHRAYAFLMSACLILAAAAARAEQPLTPTPLIDRDVLRGTEDGTKVQNADENFEEARAYNYLLVQSRLVEPEALARQARADLSFAHLFEEPSKYRGELVLLQGTLKRLRRYDPPQFAAKQ